MENGLYAARVRDESVQSVYVDEDTVFYWQNKALFQQRDDARERQRKQAEAEQRSIMLQTARERRKLREMVRSCGGWIRAGILVCLTYIMGPVAVAASAVVCFGAACFRLGGYFRKEKSR